MAGACGHSGDEAGLAGLPEDWAQDLAARRSAWDEGERAIAGRAPLPEDVDHRSAQTPVRKQVGPDCYAFAMAAALEARCGLTEHLSVQQIIGLVGNRFVGAPDDVKKILHRPLAPEGDWPYGGSPTASLEAHAKWSVEEARWTALNPRRLMEALAEGPGQNVLVDLVWLPEYLGDRGVLDAPESMNWLEAARHFYPCAADRDPKTACGQHSVLLVGYRVQAKDVVFYFKNSWGASWGVGGYGSVSGRFLRYFGLSARTITAARCGD